MSSLYTFISIYLKSMILKSNYLVVTMNILKNDILVLFMIILYLVVKIFG